MLFRLSKNLNVCFANSFSVVGTIHAKSLTLQKQKQKKFVYIPILMYFCNSIA